MFTFTPPTYEEVMEEMEEIRRFQSAILGAAMKKDGPKTVYDELRGQMVRCQENMAKMVGQPS